MGNHSLIIDEQRRLVVTGVTDVDGFDEEILRITLKEKAIIIKGKNLHIENLDLADEKLTATGEILVLEYVEDKKAKKNFLGRLLK